MVPNDIAGSSNENTKNTNAVNSINNLWGEDENDVLLSDLMDGIESGSCNDTGKVLY